MFLYPLSFVLLLTPLVFVHELGHFLFAKLFRVRVDIFSIGFGPKIFSQKKGETEYCVSAIPLGGYVKLYGQDPNEEVQAESADRSYSTKLPWQRFLILIGGPLFNFLFAIFVFGVMMVLGEPHVSPRLARVVIDSDAYRLGLRSGDYVRSVDQRAIKNFPELVDAIADSNGKVVKIAVERSNETKSFEASPRSVPGFSVYGEALQVGDIDGIFAMGRLPVIGVSDPQSAAAKAGLQTGDVLLEVNGHKVQSYEDVEALLTSLPTGVGQYRLVVESHSMSYWINEQGSERSITKAGKASGTASREIVLTAKNWEETGISSSELIVSGVLDASPAKAAGVLAGDLLLSVNGKQLHSFFELRELIQSLGDRGETVSLKVRRSGLELTLSIKPSGADSKDALGRATKIFTIGVYPLLVSTEPETHLEKTWNPFLLVSGATTRALDLCGKTVISLKKLFFREVSVGTLGGPLLIGKLAGDSMSKGFAHFLRVMALISVSLAIFNVLPVPVLDGGHILLLAVEKIRGRPMGLRQVELVQQFGLSLIMLLLAIVLFNDFSRVAVPAFQSVMK